MEWCESYGTRPHRPEAGWVREFVERGHVTLELGWGGWSCDLVVRTHNCKSGLVTARWDDEVILASKYSEVDWGFNAVAVDTWVGKGKHLL